MIKSPNVLTEAKNVIVLLARQNQVCCIVTLVTRSPLTATTWVQVLAAAAWVQICASCGMFFNLHNQCLVVFSEGFPYIIRETGNYSDSDRDCLIRLV